MAQKKKSVNVRISSEANIQAHRASGLLGISKSKWINAVILEAAARDIAAAVEKIRGEMTGDDKVTR